MLNNHLRFTILYHRDEETDLSRIVGFEVEPFTVAHSYEGDWEAGGKVGARSHHWEEGGGGGLAVLRRSTCKW